MLLILQANNKANKSHVAMKTNSFTFVLAKVKNRLLVLKGICCIVLQSSDKKEYEK